MLTEPLHTSWRYVSKALITGAFFLLLCSCGQHPTPPDLIIYHADIYTVDSLQPKAQAIAILDGRILEIGSDEDILRLRSADTETIDAHGAFMMPGFIEGHGHLPGLGASLQDLNLLNTRSWDEILEGVRGKVAQAHPGEWVIGRGWHQEKWTDTPEPNVLGYPYHNSLSLISPENPVMLIHASGHALIANAAAMELAGVSRETGDPVGGHIVRGDGGEAIGVFEENAMQIIRDANREYLTTLTEEDILAKWHDGIEQAQAECLRKGVTSFQDAGSSLEEIERMRELAREGQLSMRVWMMIRHTSEFLAGKLDPFPVIDEGDGFFTCRGLKAAVDGALGSYGAWLLEPYSDKTDFIGQNTTTVEELSALSDLCVEHNLQMCIHAIGDRANREVLDLYEQKQKNHPELREARWRIEHAQHLDTADIPRFGELGVIASMQAIHCTSDAPFVEKRLGTFRASTGAYAWRSLKDHGAVVTNGTDAPVEDVDPIASFYAMVTRRRTDTGLTFYPEQCLTREEALYAYTQANAYAAFEDKMKGSLTPGKYADLILLDQNLLTCDADSIPATHVILTMVDGVVRYRRDIQ